MCLAEYVPQQICVFGQYSTEGRFLMKKRYIVLGVVVLAGAIAGGISMKNRGEEAPEVQTTMVERAQIVQKVNATGKIQPKTQVKISADVSAKITRMDIKEGDWVEEGDFLLELDRDRYVASVESEEANVRSAQANANLVRENMEQTERVFKPKLSNKKCNELYKGWTNAVGRVRQ